MQLKFLTKSKVLIKSSRATLHRLARRVGSREFNKKWTDDVGAHNIRMMVVEAVLGP